MASVTSRAPIPGAVHFGEQLYRTELGHRVTREFYAYPNRKPHQRPNRDYFSDDSWEDSSWAYQDEDHTRHSDAYLLVQRDAALVNFDLSMSYFASLDAGEFEAALQVLVGKGSSFEPVHSLAECDGIRGVYVLVFDEYRQFYIGQSNDIRRRIRSHWSCRKGFDRLIWGTKYDSIFPVDEFRAFDTTRIYVARGVDQYELEQKAEGTADRRFCLNRMGGGEPSALLLMLTTRRRSHLGDTVSLSKEEFFRAVAEVEAAVAQARSVDERAAGALLAEMDMTIYSVVRDDGSEFLWSRRDSVGAAAARGELSVVQYSEFLVALGETVIWPED